MEPCYGKKSNVYIFQYLVDYVILYHAVSTQYLILTLHSVTFYLIFYSLYSRCFASNCLCHTVAYWYCLIRFDIWLSFSNRL